MMNDYIKNKRILDKFFDKYARPPTYEEFLKIGGKAKCRYKKGKTYAEFLQKYGYRKEGAKEVYQIVDDRGKVVFVGTESDVIEEYELAPTTKLSRYILNSGKLKYLYDVRKMEIDLREEFYK